MLASSVVLVCQFLLPLACALQPASTGNSTAVISTTVSPARFFGNGSTTATTTTLSPTPTPTNFNPCLQFLPTNSSQLIAKTGSGSIYASSCSSLSSSYYSASNVFNSQHQYTNFIPDNLGPYPFSTTTFYENATTLCDGNPRVTYSPAVIASVVTNSYNVTPTFTTYTNVFGCIFPAASPSCSILPEDCDGLWDSYSSSLNSPPPFPTVTPQAPYCANSSAMSQAASLSSVVYGCGPCTMFGQNVQLVYFPEPTTVSRNMCASTPTASLTYYGPGAVITAYAGTSYRGADSKPGEVTAVANGHTFTSGTAYISIDTVYALDRCTRAYGPTLNNVILAMHSQSVLSLRYSQNHFQYFMQTNQQTGYPVSYADFNTPVPWSAWNGQAICLGPQDTYDCGIIYENDYSPQLAIPPEITDLDPGYANCQVWYGGLYDPPLALSEVQTVASATFLPPSPLALSQVQSVASATVPSQFVASTASAMPSFTATLSTPVPTAIQDTDPSLSTTAPSGQQQQGGQIENGWTGSGSSPQASHASPSGALHSSGSFADQSGAPSSQQAIFNGQTFTAVASGSEVHVSTITILAGQTAQAIGQGVVASFGSAGLVLQGSSTVVLSPRQGDSTTVCSSCETIHAINSIADAAEPRTYFVTIGAATALAVQTTPGGPITIKPAISLSSGVPIDLASPITLTPGGAPTTLANGVVLNEASDGGLVIQSISTLTNVIPAYSMLPTDTNARQTTSRTGVPTVEAAGNSDPTSSVAGASHPRASSWTLDLSGLPGMLVTVLILIFAL